MPESKKELSSGTHEYFELSQFAGNKADEKLSGIDKAL